MKRLRTLMTNCVKMFNFQTWHYSLALRTEKWFGTPFWFAVAFGALFSPAVQVWLLCDLKLSSSVRGLVAALDFLIAFTLFAMLWGITLFGTHSLAAPTVLRDFVFGMGPKEYTRIRTAARIYNACVASSQKRSVIEELTIMPYSFNVFRKYIMRVVVVTFAVPLYFGLFLLFSAMEPLQHRESESAGHGSAVHSLEVLRDIQMGILGGTSTEHLPAGAADPASERVSMKPAAPTKLSETPSKPNSAARGRAEAMIPAAAESKHVRRANPGVDWQSVGWEVALIFSTCLYVTLVFVLLPMQIGIAGSLDRHLKSRDFWRRLLEIWES